MITTTTGYEAQADNTIYDHRTDEDSAPLPAGMAPALAAALNGAHAAHHSLAALSPDPSIDAARQLCRDLYHALCARAALPPDPTSRDILQAALAALPATVKLGHVHYDDGLTDEQIRQLLRSDPDVWDSVAEFELDTREHGLHTLLESLIPDERHRDTLQDDDGAHEDLREAIFDRDTFDVLGELAAQTGRRMFRFALPRAPEHIESHLSATPAQLRRSANRLAKAAGINATTNHERLHELLTEASYGGELVVLCHADTKEIVDAIAAQQTVTFTDPYLLIYDRYNGSGHDVPITGTVTVALTTDTVELDAGRMSWSDDIAGVVHSAYATPYTITDTP
ncbi:hypothetical protein GKE82_23395 [Conexibacter sp. W3-3-2]|uniref:hypothetical protein n=1 Tax=Conexibacter sp. W3-3-2 TaxID=2675227 RepID=UPI0012B82C70|nr:hypothetical protein [Conexibacter sp. W3-3-2]MTD47150.1 hypothetical protein [Conexibacter sp. W3-3-2]